MKTNLSLRSDFSLGRSLLQVDKFVDQAAALGYTSLALADITSIHAMPDFSARCKQAGIKPILAVTLNVHDDPTYRKPARDKTAPKQSTFVQIKVVVMDERGFKWLLKTLSLANTAERVYYHPRNGWEDFADAEGVAILTGDFYGLFSHPNYQKVLDILETMPAPVHCELCPVDTPLFDTMNHRALMAAAERDLPCVIGYPALYTEQSEAATLEILGLITTNGRVDTPWRPKQFVRDFHLQPPEHIVPRLKAAAARQARFYGNTNFSPWVHALKNTERLADDVSFVFGKMPVSLPERWTNPMADLRAACTAGWRARFDRPILGHKPNATQLKDDYLPRLKFELETLDRMGFATYFLLAQQIVSWSKKNNIMVGPGRGSVGGSLIAYLMGITDVDPIRFGLLFERFINPDRLDLPDADLDFMSSRRHEIIDFLINEYGRDRVAGIANYSTMAGASAMRDTGRVFGLTPIELQATKLVPKEQGVSKPLVEAAAQVPDIDHFAQTHPAIWRHALTVEGCMRSFGKHAAGVVVSGVPLIERAVVQTQGEDGVVVCWDKRTVEDFGLVKLDILGLSTLDVLAIAKSFIERDHPGVKVDYLSIPIDDKDVLESFSRGETTGVFQFESPGMRKLLKDLAVGGTLTFDDVTAATALYRPGPMDSGLLDDFVAIKQGRQSVSYDHPLMEPALQDTYGVIVYQEQVMKVAVDLAGFTRTEADHLRKAMGKKDKVKMAEQRDKWVDGCQKTAGMSAFQAGALFDKIEAFAGYGFNKSHAVEYSIISFWTMWLRVKYPAEYFAACMSVVDADKLPGLVKDARECGIEVLPPDVNLSTDQFVIRGKMIIAPFNAVKGSSQKTARRIMDLRKKAGGTFFSMEQFEELAAEKGSGVNINVVGRLKEVGAFATIDPTQPPPRHPDRRKAQTELMPGLIIDVVKADRVVDMSDGVGKARIVKIVQDTQRCDACSLAGKPHPTVRMPKTKARFAVVFDSPTWEDECATHLLAGEAGQTLRAAIQEAGLNVGEAYYTTLVKARKEDKFLTNEQINGCKGFLEQEMELLRPPVIVTLGSAAQRYFLPSVKGANPGEVVFDAKRDASIVVGFNPGQLFHNPAKLETLVDVFRRVAEILS